jgi:predicted XRE-type DNA-binding protein
LTSLKLVVFRGDSPAILKAFPESAIIEGVFAMNETFDIVWNAIEDNPVEAEKMKLRSSLMTALCDFIEAEGLTQKQAAKKLGVTQPRISDLKRGKIDLFAIESLVTMAALSGLRIEMRIAKAA